MGSTRKLLFHQKEVDDSVGTYVTDYVLAAVCFVMANILVYKILKNRFDNAARQNSTRSSILPWCWPGKNVTPITMTTYSAAIFQISYGSVALFGGLPHQYLQQQMESGMTWLISWRIASGLAIVSLCAILTHWEQSCQQEHFLRMPLLARKIFYIALYLTAIGALVMNFVRISSPNEPYNITNLYLGFMGGIMFYGWAMLALLIRTFAIRCRNSRNVTKGHEGGTRWDLVLHCTGAFIIVSGGTFLFPMGCTQEFDLRRCMIGYINIIVFCIFSYILTPVCSKLNAHATGCPLPDEFNHNAVMHLLHALATVTSGLGELYAINRRSRNRLLEMVATNTELLV